MRKILRSVAMVIVVLLVAGVVAYAVGVRVVLDGAGMPGLAFMKSAERQAAEIAEHRAAQRAAAPAPAPAAVVPTPTPGAAAVATERSAPDPVAPPYWTGFRGPERDGHYRQRPIRTAWPSGGIRPLWKQPLGSGFASFVAAHGRAFTIEQRGAQEVVAAYDVLTGRELWTNTWDSFFREGSVGDGPRATPTWHDGVVYALGANGELRALADADGRQVWRINILEDAGASNIAWGVSASPLVVDETVVVMAGGPNGRSVVAYDRRTGRRVWSALDDRASYASPMLGTIGGVRQLVVSTASRVVGLTPDRGELLWEFDWSYDSPPQPLILGDRVFLSTSSAGGAVMLQLTRDGDTFSVHEQWRTNRMKNKFTSSVHHDGFIYGLDEAILACIDAATGELKWKGGRYGYGQVLLASGQVIVMTEEGEIAVVRATPEAHQELVRFAGIDGKTWNHPAMADGILLVRNLTEMAAFDLRSK